MENFCVPQKFRAQGTGPECPCDNQGLLVIKKIFYCDAFKVRDNAEWYMLKALLSMYLSYKYHPEILNVGRAQNGFEENK